MNGCEKQSEKTTADQDADRVFGLTHTIGHATPQNYTSVLDDIRANIKNSGAQKNDGTRLFFIGTWL